MTVSRLYSCSQATHELNGGEGGDVPAALLGTGGIIGGAKGIPDTDGWRTGGRPPGHAPKTL
jgi:hypothetical protein